MLNFEDELENLRVNKVGQVISLHKPLLLLLTISEVLHGHKNEFLYDDIEPVLKSLLAKYGLKNTLKFNPQYPFIYLAGSPNLWHCSLNKRDLKNPNSVSRSEVLGATGSFTKEFYQFLQNSENARNCLQLLLNQYWPEAYHEDILKDLGIFEPNQSTRLIISNRSKLFVEEVLDAYERMCAICKQSIRLADTLIGIDACHVKPIQHMGDDKVTNGIALCKIHHWALDRGAISISPEMSLMVSKKLNGNKLFEYFTGFENTPVFTPRHKGSELDQNNIEYHATYIFVK